MRNLKYPSQLTRPRTYVNLRDAIVCAPGKMARASLRTKLAMQPVRRHSTLEAYISLARYFSWV